MTKNFLTKTDLDKIIKLPDNAMLKVKAELWCEWDFEKNNELGLDIWKVTKGTHKNAWWICPKCTSKYDMGIYKKTSDRGCPYCAGYRINHTNSLASLNPKIAKDWHPTKNGELTPHDIVCGNTKKVWWLGECGHEWEASTHNRCYGTNCPYCCVNSKILIGHNDLWTTHPEVAKLFVNHEDGYKYKQGSPEKIKWKCPDCENVNISIISSLCSRNVLCKKCSDGLSFGEKIIYSMFSNCNIDFEHELSFDWSQDRRYDFYIHSISMIVEVHGEQHYEQSRRGKRTLKEEQENDRLKRELAKTNDVRHYIEIDARISDIEYIKDSIIKTNLLKILNLNVDVFNNIEISHNLLTKKSWELWNSGIRVMKISETLKISKNAVRRYLKLGNSLGKCDYKAENRYDKVKKSILKLSKNGDILERFRSLIEAKNYNPKASLQVSKYPFDKIKISKNFIWIYEDEYNKYNELIYTKIKK